MSSDLDDILRAVGANRHRPRLIEVGRAVGPGPVATGYFWSTGRVLATVDVQRVTIARRRGVVADASGPSGLELQLEELSGLSTACAAWAWDRDTWAAFYYSCAGYPPGYGGACYFVPPGEDAVRIRIGSSGPDHRHGADLVGHDAIRPVERRPLGAGVAVTAELWREGEHQGPESGSLVGVRCEIGSALLMDARRDGARIWRVGAGMIHLEPGEEAFVAAVLNVVRHGRSS